MGGSVMGKINEIARQLLADGEADVVIGYGEGSRGRVRPVFARTAEESGQLLLDERCTQNLAVYIYKKETASLGKPAIVATVQTLRGIIRLAAEKQLKEGALIALYVGNNGEVTVCKSFDEIENLLSSLTPPVREEDREMLEKLDAMSPVERWVFWKNEMENCIKCYACRQACPLCYCTQCTVEANQPQWIPTESTTLGNLEWHIMRAMHLSGRCISCGQCGDACPVNIPIHLLPMKMADEIKAGYGVVSGMNREEGCAMSTFRPDDKENFIG